MTISDCPSSVPDLVEVADAAEGVSPPSRPVVVLDTSVLVADPCAYETFTNADVVIPLTVLEELDELKTRSDDVGRSARSALRSLEELRNSTGGDLSAPVEVADGTSLRIALNGLRTDLLREMHLEVRRPDNRILACGLGFRDVAPSVTVVSVDAALRVKASALGLDAVEYRHGPPPSGSGGVPVSAEVPAEVIDAVYADGSFLVSGVAGLDGVPRNAGVVLRCGTSKSVLCRRRGDELVRVRAERSAWGLRPRSKEQTFALDLLCDPEVPVVSMSGHAGTGKTLLALAAGLQQTFEHPAIYDRMMILRPVVAVGSQELGFLPGDLEEKLGPWFEAVIDAVVALGDRITHREAKAMIDGWVHDGRLTLGAVTYMRGRSLQRTWVITDECQNLEPSVAKTLLTRLGDGSKAVFVGDVTQIDSPFLSEGTNSLAVLADTFADSDLFGHIRLTRGERSAVADLAADRL